MNYEKYEELAASNDLLKYEFVSTGPKGNINKAIQFQYIEEAGIYNLAFGNLLENGSIDDLAVDDNKDRNMILATVAYAVSLFCKEYPNEWVYFTGSTVYRTRLYRMAITLNYDQLSADFEILGIIEDIDGFSNMVFQKGVEYLGFLISKKKG